MSPDKIDEDELRRYIEYLQSKLATEGVADLFNCENVKEWANGKVNSLEDFLSQYPSEVAASLKNTLINDINGFTPRTQFDIPFARYVFQPILDNVAAIAQQLGYRLRLPLRIENSTDVSITPASRPSQDNHLIFAGVGTSSFCNAWAKVYAAIFMEIVLGPKIKSLKYRGNKQLDSVESGTLGLAAKLCAYYATYSTLLFFGEIIEPSENNEIRLQLLSAMETFVIAHEYAHCFLDENTPVVQSNADREKEIELENKCDLIAFRICCSYGEAVKNVPAISGAGAILFFNSLALSERVHNILFEKDHRSESGHPDPVKRIEYLVSLSKEKAIAAKNLDIVEPYLNDVLSICQRLNTFISDLFKLYQSQK